MKKPSWPLPVAILAGGLATRLRPITETIPKALVPVNGKPFIRHQLELLQRQGIEEVTLCVGYLGEMVEKEIGSSADLNLKVSYSYDGEKLLGTGGALKAALAYLGSSFFVLYGDSYLPVSYQKIADSYFDSQKKALMTVLKNQGQWDKSNTVYESGKVTYYSKTQTRGHMDYIDYGLSILDRSLLEDWDDNVFDLATLFTHLSLEGQLAGYEIFERFYEIGSPESLAEFDHLMRENFFSSTTKPN